MNVVLPILLSIASSVGAFSTEATGGLPTYNPKNQRWLPAPDAEQPYGIGRTLLGNGPVPAFTRLTQPGNYMQAVWKFQASEKCTIRYAQGNMDQYFENPNDWAYQRRVEAGLIPSESAGYRKPYGEPIPLDQVVLTVIWGVGISSVLAKFFLAASSGNFCIGGNDIQFCRVFFPDL